jgi:hypothetical protein
MLQVCCQECGKEFDVKPCYIKYGYGKYCSRTCQYSARKKGEIVECSICKTKVYKPQKQLRASKSGLYFCGKSCQALWRNSIFKGPRHANWKGGEHVEYVNILKKHRAPICKLCKSRDMRILCVHHKDRDRMNNTLSNLVWLCYNCHHLVHHHKVGV